MKTKTIKCNGGANGTSQSMLDKFADVIIRWLQPIGDRAVGYQSNPSLVAAPTIRGMLKNIPLGNMDLSVHAHRLADALAEECSKKGNATIFGDTIFTESDISRLRELIDKAMP